MNPPALRDRVPACLEQPACADLRRTHYAQRGEHTIDDIRWRLATAFAAQEASALRARWRGWYFDAMRSGFIPAGRITAAAGTDRDATLINCFVQPIAPRRFGRDERGRPGIDQALREIALTLRMGGGVGIDLSELPSAQELDTARGMDPVSLILKMESRGRRLASTGARRAAQMALLDIRHPDALAVIDLKRHHALQTVTLSVCIPDAFMQALDRAGFRDAGTSPNGDPQYRWTRLLQAAMETGNPGLVFIDQVNRDNNLGQIEHLGACNPCGEQYLPDYGACDLGSIDLTRLVRLPFTRAAHLDVRALRRLAAIAVRALDHVIDLTHWPLDRQAREARLTRRIGLGVTGLADALLMLGLRYDRAAGRRVAAAVLTALRDQAYLASVQLARERGAFPLFEAATYLRAPHAASRLPVSIRRLISRHGIRNSHLVALAPAGTISIAMADNVSSGIEPIFAPRSIRRVLGRDGAITHMTVEDHALRRLRTLHPGTTALPQAWCDVSTIRATDHLRMIAALQPLVDSGISKTLHLPADASPRQLDQLLRTAWRLGLKGVSVFRPAANGEAVLQDARCAQR